MALNYLEQLVAEWYEYSGYFVRRNVWVGKRAAGGYECELDVVAFHPGKKELVQVEPSMDASSWTEREKRYTKKFAAGRKHIPKLFEGLDVPNDIDQIALLLFASKKNRSTLGGGRIMLVSELMVDICSALSDQMIAKNAVPEQFPALRTVQFMNEYRSQIFKGQDFS